VVVMIVLVVVDGVDTGEVTVVSVVTMMMVVPGGSDTGKVTNVGVMPILKPFSHY
jgi:hypothetical protein